jgi:hypothetical protein
VLGDAHFDMVTHGYFMKMQQVWIVGNINVEKWPFSG